MRSTVRCASIPTLLQVELEHGRLLIPRELEHADTLVNELVSHPPLKPSSEDDVLGRKTANDDLVSATSFAAWWLSERGRHECRAWTPGSPRPAPRWESSSGCAAGSVDE